MTNGIVVRAKEGIKNFLFPPFCVACNRSGSWWCEECRSSVQLLKSEICPRCLLVNHSVHQCNGALPFDRVWSLGYYHDSILRAAITALKFQGTTALRRDLAAFLLDRLPLGFPSDAVLVPMPLSEKRLKERGFNQAEIIVETISSKCGVRSTIRKDLLFRTGHRDAQSSVSHDLQERQTNVANCFQVNGTVPKKVILVDDVITTGATAAEAAKVLLAAGAEKVSILTVAIGA